MLKYPGSQKRKKWRILGCSAFPVCKHTEPKEGAESSSEEYDPCDK